MTINEIFFNLGNLMVKLVKKEFVDQGHYLSGKSVESMRFNLTKEGVSLIAKPSVAIVNEGVPASQISWKMLPALIRYFRARGYSYGNPSPKKLAELTIKRWMKEGMSTEGSQVYSKTGERQHFIERAMENPEIDRAFSFYADKLIDEELNKSGEII